MHREEHTDRNTERETQKKEPTLGALENIRQRLPKAVGYRVLSPFPQLPSWSQPHDHHH